MKQGGMDVSVALTILHTAGPKINIMVLVLVLVLLLLIIVVVLMVVVMALLLLLLVLVELDKADDGTHEWTPTA